MTNGKTANLAAFQTEEKRRRPDAGEILAERFARGEISDEEFEQRRRVLERTPA